MRAYDLLNPLNFQHATWWLPKLNLLDFVKCFQVFSSVLKAAFMIPKTITRIACGGRMHAEGECLRSVLEECLIRQENSQRDSHQRPLET